MDSFRLVSLNLNYDSNLIPCHCLITALLCTGYRKALVVQVHQSQQTSLLIFLHSRLNSYFPGYLPIGTYVAVFTRVPFCAANQTASPLEIPSRFLFS